MMVRKFHIAIYTLFTVMFGSCSDPIEVSEPTSVPYSPGTVTISFKNSNMTRSDDSEKSETKIENLTVGLYVDSPDETVAPVAFQTFESLTNVYQTHQVVMQLTDDMIDKLFTTPGKNHCRIFAVANVPEGTTVPYRATITQMKQLRIEADFRNTSLQSSFVMTGTGEVTYNAPGAGEKVGSASGAATLYRAAAKIRLNLQIPDTIHVGNDTDFEIWEPVKANVRALLNKGVQVAVAAPEGTADIPWKPGNQNAYYNSTLKTGSERSFKNEGTGTYSYIMDVPFYTYPNAWTESTLEDNKTTLTLILPWGKQGEQSWNTYYYQIPITPVDLPHLDRNYSYTVNLKVGMLGSLTPEEEVTPEEDLSYQIVNWGEEEVGVDIKDFRYLVVNPNVVTVNNEAEILIPFYSSHPVAISDINMTFQRFNYFSNGNGDVVDIKVDQDIIDSSTWTHNEEENGTTKQVTDTIVNYSIVKDPSTNQYSIKIKHPLSIWIPYNGDSEVQLTEHSGSGTQTIQASNLNISRFVRPTSPETPYSKYVFTLKIEHQDNKSYSEEITVTQYPGMYITADRNPGGGGNTYPGNVIVNNSSSSLGGVTSLSGNNSNPNMYVINISQLDATSNYIIGDPRMSVINNNLSTETGNYNRTYPDLKDESTAVAGNWCNLASAIFKELPNGTSPDTRRLAYYYPTSESQDSVYKMRVAPKFRVASSYGKTSHQNRDNARRRIATYQERGYPAGRWRLPTYGELQFINSLSGAGKIPVLFTRGVEYWTAQGKCMVNADGTITLSSSTSGTAAVRGVYDDWYWEQFPEYAGTIGSYKLGDVPKK